MGTICLIIVIILIRVFALRGAQLDPESTFVSSSYIFTSPNHPLNYPNNFEYTWYFSTDPGSQLLITFNAISTEDGYDYIYVREGSNISAIGDLLLRWSGTGLPNELRILSSERFIWVTFESDGSITYNGFVATVEVTNMTREELNCGTEFDCENGVCLSQSRVCDEGSECGNNADETNGTCRDSCSPSEFRCYDGSCIPEYSQCDGYSDCSEGEDEFWCHGTTEYIFVSSSYIFNSPNYPLNYPNNFEYTWHFSTDPGSQLLITFNAISTEPDYDYIYVREGSNISALSDLLLEWSGTGLADELRILSSENLIWATFESDGSITYNGFVATVEATNMTREELNCGTEFDCENGVCLPQSRVCDGGSECGNNVDETSGTCTDICGPFEFSCYDGSCIPGYWQCDGYPDCDGGEDESFCNEPSTCGPLEFSCYDGSCIPGYWQCDGYSNCLGGEDELWCHESIFVNSTYIFNSPNYPSDYPNNLEYTWYFSTIPGSQLLITFNVISTEPDFDYIYVGEGNNISAISNLLLSWSGTGSPNELRILSSENIIWVTFESDGSVTYNGFLATVEVTNMTREDSNCSAEDITLMSNQSTLIHSTNFSGFYFPNMECTWIVVAPENHSIIVRTIFLELGEDDSITIGRGQNALNTSNTIFVIRTNEIRDVAVDARFAWIRFSSGSGEVTTEDFLLEVVALSQRDFERETFQCESGQIINQSKVCDGVNDCPDFADEDECPPCVDVSQTECQPLIPYQQTIFPHPLAVSPDEASNHFSNLSFLTGCHPSINMLLCSLLYPDCPHTGPVTRPCRSFCLNVTNSCKALYEEMMVLPWPINCDNYDDNLPVGDDGFCNGGDDDVFNTEICGTRPAAPIRGRIVGGTEASFGDWPWIASLRDEFGDHQCGATLITERWAITAAHCIGHVSSAIFGDLYLFTSSTYHHETTFTTHTHPQYNPYTKEHDIALLELDEPVNFSDYVRPSCLSTLRNETDVYQRCYIVGWGHLMEAAITLPNRLQEALIQLFTAEECLNYLPRDYIEDSMLCAGYDEGGIDTCQGDSGGPLVCEGHDGRWHLVGVTSFGYGCALPMNPGVYTRISQHIDFIKSHVG